MASRAAGHCERTWPCSLPELGEGAASSDRATIFEAVRCAFAMIASEGAAIVVLDDLQWSDGATLELLAAVGPTLEEIPMLGRELTPEQQCYVVDVICRWIDRELTGD